MILVTFEGVSSRAMTQLFLRLKRRLHSAVTMAPVDHHEAVSDPFIKVLRLFEALHRLPRDCPAVLSPVSFYNFMEDGGLFVEFAAALQAALDLPIALHLMFVLVGDAHELLDECLDRGAVASLEETEADNAAIVDVAKHLAGHPWPAWSVVLPVPRYALDTPVVLDKLVSDMHHVTARTLEKKNLTGVTSTTPPWQH